ncbi:MAG TPA: TlpA family protein disulfide reductase [Deltaproteobacteria bacterium]|nr:MAG: thiol:disulfide interchange protein [bacterium]HDH10390.1 TlpA family protein disulfide reductase [Deltaproteobacteria bacterium]
MFKYKKSLLLIAALFIGISLISGCKSDITKRSRLQTEVRNQTDSLSFHLLDGKTVNLSKDKGKVVILNYFATWCPACKAEMPELTELYRNYKNRGFDIISISTDRQIADVPAFVKQFSIPYRVALENPKNRPVVGSIEYLPTNIIIDRQGKIYKRIIGIIPQAEWRALIEKLLRENR